MPILSVSWSDVISRYADETQFVALTARQISVLSSLVEQLHWEKTWRTEDHDTDNDEQIRLEVNDLIANLTMPVNLVDLLQYIDEVEGLLRSIESLSGCCGPVDITDGDQYTDVVTDGAGSVPQNIIDAGYATDANDWDGFDDYKCMVAHVMVTSMGESLRKFLPTLTDAGLILGGLAAIGAIIGAIIATGGTALVLGIIAGASGIATAYAALTELGQSGVDSLATSWDSNHDELVCAIYNADGTSGAVTALKDKIDELYSDANALLLKNMNLDASLKALYAGRYDQQNIAQKLADAGYDVGSFTCSCTTATEEVWDYSFDVDNMSFALENSWRTLAWDSNGYMKLGYPSGGDWSTFQGVKSETGEQAVARFSVNEYPSKVDRFEMRFRHVSNGYGGLMYIRIVYYNPSTEQVVDGPYYASTSYAVDTWHTVQWEQSPQVFLRANNWFMMVRCRLGSSSLLPKHDVDYVKVIRDL